MLGRLIEVVSREPYQRYIYDRVLAKAPGTRFFTIADEASLDVLARGYAGGKPSPPLDNSWPWAAGNLVGTVGDLIAWDRALNSGEVISAADYAVMIAPQTPPGSMMTAGFPFFIDRYEDQPRIWHDGSTIGFSTADQ